jgi:hypothetical protein
MDVVGDNGYLRECYADVGVEEQQVHIRATRRTSSTLGVGGVWRKEYGKRECWRNTDRGCQFTTTSSLVQWLRSGHQLFSSSTTGALVVSAGA